jgi:hypothetical protein
MRVFCQPNIQKLIRLNVSGLYVGPVTYHSLLQRNDLSTAAKDDDMRHLFFLKLVCFACFLPIGSVLADEAPNFDVAASCRAGENIGASKTDFSACMQKENEARDQLKAQWAQFTQRNKAECIQLCNCGGVAGSYIELLTCLQMATPGGSGLGPNPLIKEK